jgi:sec-independent protein translocase protein TatC
MNEEHRDDSRMSFLDHLEELRSRLLKATLAVVAAFAACMYFGEQLFSVMAEPILRLLPKGSPIYFPRVQDPFFVYLKVSLITGIFIVFPYVIYQLWAFVRPGLYPQERKLAAPFVTFATLLFYAGASFAYFLVLPAAFSFFLSYITTQLQPLIDMREYVDLVMLLMLAFAAVFETPIIIVFLGLIGLFSSDQLKKGRRYFIVLAFIIAAIVTPTPDPFNQTLMAVPMLLLYEVGIRLLAIIERRRAREAEAEERQQEQTADQDQSGTP